MLKKRPIRKFNKESNKKAIIGIMASESRQRQSQYIKNGCNAFNLGVSRPLAFWEEQDVLKYLKDFNIPYASVYGDIIEDENGNLITTAEKRTGCMFCMFGVHMEKRTKQISKNEKYSS